MEMEPSTIVASLKMRNGRREMELIRKVAEEIRNEQLKQKQCCPIIPDYLLKEFRDRSREKLFLSFLRYKTTAIVKEGDGFLSYEGEGTDDPSFIQRNTNSALVNTRTLLTQFLEAECLVVQARTASLRSGSDAYFYRLRSPEEQLTRDACYPQAVFEFPPEYGEPLEDDSNEQEEQNENKDAVLTKNIH